MSDKLTLINVIKVILALLLFVCLFNMPYGYYQVVRFIAMVSFAFLAFDAFQQNEDTHMFLFLAMALLFQPVFKIALGRQIWNIVDVIVGLGLIISIFLHVKGIQEKQ